MHFMISMLKRVAVSLLHHNINIEDFQKINVKSEKLSTLLQFKNRSGVGLSQVFRIEKQAVVLITHILLLTLPCPSTDPMVVSG